MNAAARGLGWVGIVRLGLVQAAIGMVVVLTTSLLNRVMVVELGLAASVPGALVGLHYALQVLRPVWGHGSDGRRRTPWIVGGMALLAIGGTLACLGVATMATRVALGLGMTIAGFAAIGVGVGAAGTALLTLLADSVPPARRPAASAIVWITMIVGFILATAAGSALLRPFSPYRLGEVGAGICAAAFVLAALAVRGVEPERPAFAGERRPRLGAAIAAVWADAEARRFTWFILVSMLAYSAQDLILEPFAGFVFDLPPAATTALTSLQNGGVLCGMIAAALLGRGPRGGSVAGLRRMTVVGCLGSAAALGLIVWAAGVGLLPAMRLAIAALGFANGVFAVSAIGLMMGMAGPAGGAGARMGVWGAAQAVAFGGGGFLGTVSVDLARIGLGARVPAYASVFLAEAGLFVVAAAMMRGRAAAALAVAAE